jgi:hypothetical protein
MKAILVDASEAKEGELLRAKTLLVGYQGEALERFLSS